MSQTNPLAGHDAILDALGTQPRPKVQLHVRIDRDLFVGLKQLAARNDTSLGAVVEHMLKFAAGYAIKTEKLETVGTGKRYRRRA